MPISKLNERCETMSYCSENRLPLKTPINRLIEVIELLGYKKGADQLKLENQIAFYYWNGDIDHISFVGITLHVYKEEDHILVTTRTRIGRSYWDLQQQNKTISLLKSLFGGSFCTDEGGNRYMKFDIPEPSKLACSLFVARWVFHNALINPSVYLSSRKLTGGFAEQGLTGLPWIDEMNPMVLSNNMLIPYIIGCWESYFRQSFISIVRYADNIPDKALKNCRISNLELLQATRQPELLVYYLADSLSFQRPTVIAENFKQLNPKIDIASWLRKPYHNRKKTLFDSIADIIDLRDKLVHTGTLSIDVSDQEVKRIIADLTEAANRIYDGFGMIFDFEPSYNF